MKKRTKRILAMLLASAMILQQGSTVGVLATETEPVSETVAETTAAETMAQETQAPETTAETKAPETQATETALGTTQTETAAAEQTETAAPQIEQTETPAATEATEATETAAETTGSTEQSETMSQETTAQETTETSAQTEEKTDTAEETATEKATEAATEAATERQLMMIGMDVPMVISEVHLNAGALTKYLKDSDGVMVNFTIDGAAFDPDKEYSVKTGFTFEMSYSFDDEKKNAYLDEKSVDEFTTGTITFEYDLPSSIIIDGEGLSGPISDSNGGTMGRYRIEGGKVYFDINADFLKKHGNVTGKFSYSFKINENELKEKNDVELKFPGSSSNVKIKVQKPSVDANKTYDQNLKFEDNFWWVYYTIMIKGGERDCNGANSVVVVDSPGSNLEIDQESITIDDNSVTIGVEVAEDGKITIKGIEVPAGTEKVIKYRAKIKNLKGLDNKFELKNTVDWYLQSDKEPEDHHKDSSLWVDKTVSSSKGNPSVQDRTKLHWTVKLNEGQLKDDVSGKTYVDELTSTNQQYDWGSFRILKDGVDVTEKYKNYITKQTEGDKKSFSLTLPSDAGRSTFEIQYDTILETDLAPGGEITVTNTGTFDGKHIGSGSGTVSNKSDASVSKTKEEFNQQELTQKWSVTVTPPYPEGWEDGFEFFDILSSYEIGATTYTGDYKGFVFDEDSFVIKDASGKAISSDKYKFAWGKSETAKAANAAGHDWVKIKFSGEYHDEIIISYETKADANHSFKNGDSGHLQNTSVVGDHKSFVDQNWYSVSFMQSMFKSADAAKYDSKTGKNSITWKIYANVAQTWDNEGIYDLSNMSDVTVVDTLPKGLTYIEGSGILQLYHTEQEHNNSNNPGYYKTSIEPTVAEGEEGSILTFKIPQDRIKGKYVIYIEFQTETEEQNATFKNVATWGNGSQTLGNAEAESKVEYKVLTKEGGVIKVPAEGDNIDAETVIEYTITVNPEARDYVADSDTLKLTDTLPDNVTLVNNSVSITDGAGHAINGAGYEYDTASGLLTIAVPDGVKAVVKYRVLPVLDGLNPTNNYYEVEIKNVVQLTGEGSYETSSTVKDKVKKAVASITGDADELKLSKVDAQDTSLGLEGAVFKLVKLNFGSDGTYLGEGEPVTGTTNDKGIVSFKGILPTQVYYYQEVTAPNGFEKDDTKYYICYYDADQKAAYETLKGYFEAQFPGEKLHGSNGGKTYTVTNHASSKARIRAKKTLSGADISKYTFTFELTEMQRDVSGEFTVKEPKNVQSTTNTGEEVIFPEIDYREEGTYYYKITESKENPVSGITYDMSEHIVSVEVTRNVVNGQLKAKVVYPDGKIPVFENIFEEAKGSLKVTKNVVGNNTDTTTTFHFRVTLKDGENAAAVNGTFDGVVFKNGVATFDLTPDSERTASQTITGLPAGLNYTVKEFTNEGEKTGYTLTGTTGATGTIEAGRTKTAVFTNTRNKTTVELKVIKTYNDEFPTDDVDKFSFTLRDDGNDVSPAIGTPMPDGSVAGSKPVKVTSETAETFGSITYEEDGTYNYTITENSGSLHGVTYDTSVYHVKVKVTTDTKGNKSAAISVAKAENAETSVTDDDYVPQGSTIYTAGFNNTYVADGSANLSVQKEFNGTFPTGEKAFRFTLTAGTNTVTDSMINTPMPEGTNGDGKTKTVSVESGAVKSFGVITYEQDGDYFYTINEVTTGTGVLSDVIYDTKTYYIKVSVSPTEDETATKKATVWYSLTSNEGPWYPTNQAAYTVTFNNYKIQDAKAVLKVQKIYNGRSDKIPAGGFSFALEAQGNAPMPAGVTGNIATVNVSKSNLENATGAVEKSFGEIEYTTNGTYTYTIKESIPTGAGDDGIKDGILYDTTQYTVTVTVGAGQNGQKSVVVSYSADGATKASASFTNTEVEEQTDATGSVEITAKKSMKKDADKALIPTFSFELAWAGAKDEAPEGQKLPMTETPDADGNMKFTLPFTMDDYEAAHPTEEGVKAKEFKYTLKELAENGGKIIYDDTVYNVTVTLGDEIKDGKFTVTYTVEDNKELKFVNDTTTVKVDKVDEAGNKLSGAKLQITEKGTLIDSWTTGSATHDVTGKLEVGKTYVLEETDVPAGYVVAPQVEFTIDADGNVLVAGKKVAGNLIQMTDAKLHFNVNKTELGTGDEVEGAELTVYEKQADGTLKKVEGASWTSKKGETHDFGEKLEAGKTYVLREEVAPDGYGYVTDIEFTVEKDGKITTTMPKTKDAAGNDTYLVEDARIRLEVDKRATGTGEELDGAVLELLDAAGNVVESWTSKKGETHDFGGKLKAGESYTLRETIAPDGYTCVTDMKFTVGKDGTVNGLDSIKTTDANGNTVYVVEDTLNRVSIQKVDESGAALAGAKLVIKDADGKAVASWTTDGKAHEITGLATGKYTLSEVEAPEGYQVSKDVPFEITGKEAVGSVIELLMTDTKIPESNKYSLTVTKHLHLDGITGDLAAKEATYYVALFSDEAKTQRVSNVKKIEFKNATSSTVTFDKLAAGTYYVGETDENGTLLVSKIVNDKLIFHPEYTDGGKAELEGKKTEGTAEFTNVYMELPSGFYLSGQLTVTKKVLVNGAEGTSDETYYARVFSDKKLSTPASDVLALDLAGGTSASVTVTDLPIGESIDSSMNYYVAETDENGKPLDPDAVTEFEISIDKSEVVLSANNSAQEVVITNNFVEEETETETETETEVEKKEAPKTGDDTDFMRYLLLMAFSAGTCAIAFEEKRRRNRARK